MLWLAAAFAAATATVDKGVVVTDETHELTVTGHLLIDQSYTVDLDVGKGAFVLQRLRPDLRIAFGQVPVEARLQTDWAGTPALVDATIQFGPKNLHVTAGRMLTPTGRAQLTPVPLLASQGFAPSERIGRNVGVLGEWRPPKADVQAGLFQDADRGTRAIGRAALQLGAGVPYDETSARSGKAAPGLSVGTWAEWATIGPNTTVAGELAAQAGPVRLQAEGFYRTGDQNGAYLQGSVTLVPNRLDLVGRFDHTTAGAPPVDRVDGLFTYYLLGPHVRVQAGLGHVLSKPGGDLFVLQSQMWF